MLKIFNFEKIKIFWKIKNACNERFYTELIVTSNNILKKLKKESLLKKRTINNVINNKLDKKHSKI